MPINTSAYVALANVTINGSGVASFTFSNIDQGYRDLILIGQVGNTGTTGFGGVFNGDTGSNYSYVYASGNGSNFGSGVASGQALANFGANSWSTGSLDLTYTIHLMDYSANDKHKTFLARSDGRSSSSNASINAGRWASTSAITSIQIRGLGSSNFVPGSTFSLYGIAS